MNKYSLVRGKSKGKTLSQVAQLHGMTADELRPQFVKGTKHELEHTNSSVIAKRIALDHLVEFPDYYDRLDKVEKMKTGAVLETPVKLNDIVLYYEKKGNWLFAKGNFYAWLYDEKGVGEKIESGEYDFVMFPPMGKGNPFSSRYIPPLMMVWNKPYQKKLKGSEHLLGIVKGFYDEDTNEIIIDMMTTNPKYRRQGINAHIIKSLREEFGVSKENVIFDKPTKEGTKFMQSGKFEKGGMNKPTFYRAVTEDLGLKTTFVPKNRYEAFDDEGNPITRGASDIFMLSDKLEISASKSVGGAILGLWTMFNTNGINPIGKKVYIYTISATPYKDLSHVRMADFEYLKEVRYDKPILGKRIGYFEYDQKFNEDALNFYGRISDDDPYSEMEYDIDAWEDFEHYILTLNESDLIMYKRGGETHRMHLGGDMSKHLAPNGKPSNLNHEQWHLVRTPEFKAWFGDWENDPENASKVVDENGEPLVVYHGSIVETNFDIFDYKKADLGFHFGTKEQAKNRVESKGVLPSRKSMVNPFFLNIRVLFEMTDVGEWQYPQRYIDEMISDNIIEEKVATQKGFLSLYMREDNAIIRDYLKSKYGNSVGFVYNNKYEGKGKSFIALSQNEIKLADGTNTTFDGNNPDIRFAKGGRTIAQTPAPASDRVYGSKTNPKGSASDSELAKSIKFNDKLEKAIENKVEAYNEKHRNDKVSLSTAKAVVRRGMGAYSKSHRPTISGGAPNSRQAWGLARLNKFLLKKSGEKVKSAYVQDDDLLKYANGGQLELDIKSNPYLKPSNCTDISDVDYALDSLRELDDKYGSDNPKLLKIWEKMLDRKKYLESKE